jgi:hypothetical protein
MDEPEATDAFTSRCPGEPCRPGRDGAGHPAGHGQLPPPDPKALQKLACEQAAANLDLQSVSQMDALRKALGVAPDVDPISACKALGAPMDAAPEAAEQTESQP